jgi:HEAT repeats
MMALSILWDFGPSVAGTTRTDRGEFLPAGGPAAYTGAVTSRRSAFTRIAFTLIILLTACRAHSLAETDTACSARVQSMLPRFLAVAGPFDENLLSSSLEKCGDMAALTALLDALAQPVIVREALEVEGAVEAVLRSPQLARDPAATRSLVDRFGAVRNSGARAALSYLLGRRDAAPALSRILHDDPAPEVRAAAAVSLRNCKTPPDFAALWRAAKIDPDRYVRAVAYQTLDHFGQLRTADDFLAASRAQIDAASTGRFLRSWLKARRVPDKETAETLTRLSEHTGSGEASGALYEIFAALQPPPEGLFALVVTPPAPPLPLTPSGPAMAPIVSAPIAAPKPEESELQRALYLRHERITRAAIAQFAASAAMQEDVAGGAIDCALAINRCGPSECQPLAELLRDTDRMAPPMALEASHDISSRVGALYSARRHYQYGLAFLLAFLMVAAMLVAGYARISRRLFAIGAGWLLILSAAALLQFSSGPIMGVSVWSPLGLWPATALGSVTVTLLLAVAVALACGPKLLAPAALVGGELSWWLVLILLSAAGLDMKMQHYSRDEDWFPFMLALFMVVGGPSLTLAISRTAWTIQQMVLPRPLES